MYKAYRCFRLLSSIVFALERGAAGRLEIRLGSGRFAIGTPSRHTQPRRVLVE